MNRRDLAEGLIELWESYMAKSTSIFPPSMTDFIQWLREHEIPSTEQEIKPTRTDTDYPNILTTMENSATPDLGQTVYSNSADEPSVAQYTGGAELGTVETVQIMELWKEGHSAARIRQMLKLKVPISRIYAITQKKH